MYLLPVKPHRQINKHKVRVDRSGNCDCTLSPLDVSLTHIIDFELSFQSFIQVEDKYRITGETNENKLLL